MKKVKRTIFLALLFCGLWSVYATPPTPPFSISIDRASLKEIKKEANNYLLPVQITASQKANNVLLLFSVDNYQKPTRQTFFKKEKNLIFNSEKESKNEKLEIPTNRFDKPGDYIITIQVSRTINRKVAIYDKKVLFIRKTNESLMVYSPEEFQKLLKNDRLNDKNEKKTSIKKFGWPLKELTRTEIGTIKEWPDKTKITTQPALMSSKVIELIEDERYKTVEENDPIHIRGRVVFQDFEGTLRPLVNASVSVMDDDVSSGDDWLVSVCTDWNGNFSVTVNNDDGFLQNGRDIYICVFTRNTAFGVVDADGDDYMWTSVTFDDLSEGRTIDFGTFITTINDNACQVFNFLNRGWAHVVTAGQIDPGYIEAAYPSSAGTYWPGGSDLSQKRIQVESEYHDGPDVVLHEYGHGLMYYAFGEQDLPGPGGSHSFGDVDQDVGLAWSEGWATGFMLSVLPDGEYNWHEGNTEAAGEWPSSSVQNDYGQSIEDFCNSNRTGELNEGRVAGAINDFLDAHDDTNGGNECRGRSDVGDTNATVRLPFSILYKDILWGNYFDTFLDYWSMLTGEVDDNVDYWVSTRNIMYYNWMSDPTSKTCVASKVIVKDMEKPGPVLAGLRLFRDFALKPTEFGRHLIQSYYSSSPELAVLLIKDEEAKKAAANIVIYFSEMGHQFGKQAKLKSLLEKKQKFLSDELMKDIESVFKMIETNGSDELKKIGAETRSFFNEYKGLTLQDALKKLEDTQGKERDKKKTIINPQKRLPSERNIDWKELDKKIYKPKVR